MKPLKFRAWSLHKQNEGFVFSKGDMSDFFDLVLDNDGRPREFYCAPEQYIGIQDKNGQEIYEGDILRVFDWGIKHHIVISVSKVYWDIEEIGWNLEPDPVDGCRYDLYRCPKEVIGNIHKNPELMKRLEEKK